jgi:serine/threonine protein kinase/Leucine-rich repeat (LRR) protein
MDTAMAKRQESSSESTSAHEKALAVIFELPRKYAGYRLVGRVGWGGGGDVWKAQDQYGNTIAFKVLAGSTHASQDKIQRFVREGHILANLHHHGICHVHDIDRVGTTLYIAMEYIDGVSLDKLINFLTNPTTALTVKLAEADTEGLNAIIDTIDRTTSRFSTVEENHPKHAGSVPTRILPLQQCLAIVMKICEAIQFAHERGVLHRDIKPSNVIIRRDGEPVVLDFGIAKTHDEMPGSLTQTGEVFGTIDYMAPEQARSSRDVDERTDVYSIGAMLYQLVTGRRHFVRSGNIYQDITTLKHLAPTRPRAFSRDIDHDLEAIILKALAPDPAERYRSAKQLHDDLARYRAGEPVRAKRFTWTYLFAKWAARHRTSLTLTSVTLVLVLSFGGYFLWNHYRQWGRWVRVYRTDFTRGEYTPADFVFTGRDSRYSTAWRVDSLGLLMERFGTAWMSRITVPGDVRVVVSMRFDDVPDGFEIIANAAPDTTRAWSFLPRGYSCQYGGYFGSLASVSANHEEGAAPKSMVMPVYPRMGREYELMLERHGRRVSLWVDGKTVVSLEEPVPLYGSQYGRIGLRCYTTTVHIVEIAVYHRALPEKAPPMIAGDALLAAGAVEAAIQSYRSVAGDHRGTAIGEEAMARALMAAMRLAPPRRDSLISRLHPSFLRLYPDSKRMRAIEEARIMSHWYAEEYDEVVRRLTAHCERHPGGALAQRIVDAAPDSLKRILLERLTPKAGLRKVDVGGLGPSSLRLLEACDLYSLDCSDNGVVRDLSPLGSMRSLVWLDCSDNAIDNLDALRGKPLVYVNANHNALSDIAALRALPLRYLAVSDNDLVSLPALQRPTLKVLQADDNAVSDLSPLRGLAIKRMAIGTNEIADLSPLAGMPLEYLACCHNNITSLEPLRGMPLLTLACSANRIGDVSPLAGLPLEDVNLSRNPVGSLEALRGKHLRRLLCRETGVTSVEPLRGMPLEVLDISSNAVVSLEPLRGCPLRHLWCRGTPLSSLEALRGMGLVKLFCSDCRVNTLAPLAGMPLVTLDVGNRRGVSNAITSLEPLRRMRLRELNLMHNKVTSLDPLRGMPLRYLNCEGNPLRTLEPFVERPPRTFLFYSERLPLRELERARAAWQGDSATAHHARHAEIYLRIRHGRWERLRELGTERAGHRYLAVPLSCPFDEAVAMAERAGGRLVAIGDREELAFVDRLSGDEVLTGGYREKGRWYWHGGEPFHTGPFHRDLRHCRHEEGCVVLKNGRLAVEPEGYRRPFVIEWDERPDIEGDRH